MKQVAVGFALLLVAGCGSSSAVTENPGAQQAAQPGQAQTQGSSAAYSPPAQTAATPTAARTSGSGTQGGTGDTVSITDGQGDSYTQVISFGTPGVESQYQDAVSGMETCQVVPPIPARNIAVPVTITTTLNSSIQTQIPVSLDAGPFISGGQDNPSTLGLQGAMVIYQTSVGDQCEPGGTTGAEVTLSQGQSATVQAWLVFVDAVSPSHPLGDPAALGQTYVAVVQGAHATGPDVCSGNTETDTSSTAGPPYLHFAGTVYPFENCTGSYS